MATMDPMVQIAWFKQRLLPLNTYSDAGVAEFNLNLSLDYIIIDSILNLLVPSFFQPTIVNAATIDHSNYGVNQHSPF